MATIDNLNIEIKADADKAAKSILNLANALSAFNGKRLTGENLEKLAHGFTAVKNSCLGIRKQTLSNVENLASSLERLANAQSQLNRLGTTLRNINKVSGTMPGKELKPEAKTEPKESALIPATEKTGYTSAEGFEKLSRSASKATINLDNLKKALSAVARTAASSALKSIQAPFIALGNAVKSLLAPFQNIMRSLARIALYRAIRSAIKAISSGIKEGVQNLAMFSYMMKELDTHKANRVLSLYSSNFLYLKNAIATAVIPVLKMLEPIIDSVINKMVDLINVAAQLTSFLSGSVTYTKAKYFYQDYAENLDKASGSASKLNKQLAKFDELNNLTTNQGSGGGKTVPDYLSMFEDPVPIEDWIKHIKDMDFYTLGRTIANKVEDSLNNIKWGEIYSKAMHLGTDLGDFLNGLISPGAFKAFGKTIGGGVMTAIKFAFSFGDTFDFKNLGESIAEGINGFFGEFDGGQLADTVDVWVKGLKDVFTTAAKKINWKEIFSDLFNFFTSIDIETVGIAIAALGTVTGINLLRTGIANLITAEPVSIPSIGIAIGGGYLVGLGAGEIIATAFGKEELANEYSQLNPFSGGTYGELTYGFFEPIFDFWKDPWKAMTGKTFGKFLKEDVFVIHESFYSDNPYGVPTEEEKRQACDKMKEYGRAIRKAIGDGFASIDPVYKEIRDSFKENGITIEEFFGIDKIKAAINNVRVGIQSIKALLGFGDFEKTSSSFGDIPTEAVKALNLKKTDFIKKSDVVNAFKKIGGYIVEGIKKGFLNAVAEFATFTWFTENIFTPVMTNICAVFGIESPAKTMYPVGENIVLGIFEGFKLVNFFGKMQEWWNNNIAPWFTTAQWQSLANGIKTGFTNKWEETKSYFNGNEGFNSIVTKAQNTLTESIFWEIGNNIARGLAKPLENAFIYIAQAFTSVRDFISSGITLTINVDMEQLKQAVVTANELYSLGNQIANLAIDEIANKTITPDQIIDYGKRGDTTIIQDNNDDDKKKKSKYVASRAGMPSHFASGGYPIQGSLFVAGEAGPELVGNINGKTGVANNDQITEAMYQATYDAMSKALSEHEGRDRIEVDPDGLFRFVRNRANEYFNSTGNSPFPA